MSRRRRNTSPNFWIITFLATKSGGIIGFCTIVGCIAAVAYFANDLKRDVELVDVKRDFSIQIIKLNEEISILKFENKKLKENLSDYEKKRGK